MSVADGPRRARTLLVEDNFVIALEFADRVERMDIVVDGPHASADEARSACERQLPDAAILDVSLRGGTSVELGEWLAAQGVAVLFVTGYSQIPALPETLAAVPRLRKPIADAVLERALLEQLAARER